MIRKITSNYPIFFALYLIVKRRNTKISDLLAIYRRDVDIYAGGFQRSGNTFLSYLLKNVYTDKKIVTHFHKPAVLKLSLKKNVQSVVPFRDPLSSVSSSIPMKITTVYGVLDVDDVSNDKLKKLISTTLYDYVNYHKIVLDNISKIHLVNFTDLIENPETIIQSIDKSYFLNNSHKIDIKDLNARYLEKKNRQHRENPYQSGLPNDSKETYKKKILSLIIDDKLYSDAESIYKDIVNYYNNNYR